MAVSAAVVVVWCLLGWPSSVAEAGDDVATLAATARNYYLGLGVKTDYARAFKLYQAAADQGDTEGQNGVGVCYAGGTGVRRDEREAVKWFRLAAAQGLGKAQLNLADCCQNGRGTRRDPVEALAWAWIAATGETSDARAVFAEYARKLSAAEIAEARRAALGFLRVHAPGAQLPALPQATTTGRLVGTGTGFFITNDGYLLTSYHVVSGGNRFFIVSKAGRLPAEVAAFDKDVDLALLKVDGRFDALPLGSSSDMRLGQTVFTVGFPNVDLQGLSPKLTKGEISSLAGVGDNGKLFQISVPIQPGNSGGALVDEHGRVVGVICSQLSATRMARAGRALPQNVNYAVKIDGAQRLLRACSGGIDLENGNSAGRKSFDRAMARAEAAAVIVAVYEE